MTTQTTYLQQTQLHEPDSSKVDLQTSFEDLQLGFYQLEPEVLESTSETYQSWMQLFENDSQSQLQQHPEHVIQMLPLLQKEFPGRPSYLMLCYKEGTPIAAGIYCPKSMSTKTLRAIGPARVLQGYYLCGNNFLMQNEFREDLSFLEHLLESTLEFCKQLRADFLILDDVLNKSPINQTLEAVTKRFLVYSHTGFQPRSLIHFPENPADYWNQFRSKSRRKHRKLLRDNSQLKLVRVTRPDQVVDFLEAAHQVSLNTWQTQRLGLRVHNNDQELNELMFLALHDALRSYLLMDGDRPIAFKFGSQHRGTFLDIEFGFDLDYASLSPGETLLLLILEDLIEHDPPRLYDFGEGDAMYKQRYSSDITESRSVLLLPDTLKNRSLLSYLRTSCHIDQFTRKLLKASGLYTGLRQLVRYGKLGSR